MNEKIPSIKDFIIYVIPGVMICFCALTFFNNHKNTGYVLANDISKDIGFAFLSVLFSFIVGFVFCQFQIIILGLLIKKKKPYIRTLYGANLNENIKDKIIEKYFLEFPFEKKTSKGQLMKDSKFTDYIVNRLILNNNQEGIKYFERDSNLSSFAISLPIPIILLTTVLLNQFNINMFTNIIVMPIISIIIISLCVKISINFRKGCTQKLFYQYLILKDDNLR